MNGVIVAGGCDKIAESIEKFRIDEVLLAIPSISENDKKKIDFAKSLGYDIFIVWDNDYKKDKLGILEKCLDFLNIKK